MAKRVIVTIDAKTGSMTFEVNGVVGTSCTDITSLLIAGQEAEEERYTEEYAQELERPDFINEEK
jgi:hypothetical protein